MNAQQILKRLSQLKSERVKHETTWKDCYTYCAPERQQSFQDVSALGLEQERKTARNELYDTTACEGTAGAALYERALGNVTTNLNIIAKMRSLFSEYGYRDSLVDPNDETLTMWQQSCNTAWILLAYKPNGFMNVN